MTANPGARSFLAPEVLQASGTDCGPAALKCLLEGFGIRSSYGRLRETCQTDVDGTSIDTIEDVACALGLCAEQTMVPAEHFRYREADLFPSLVVIRNPYGFTHFVVAWRKLGRWVQVMDPERGRYWCRAERLLEQLVRVCVPIEAEAWRSWMASDEGCAVLRARFRRLGTRAEGERLLAKTKADPTWHSFARLDYALRQVSGLVRIGELRPGSPCAAVLSRLFATADLRESGPDADGEPAVSWSVCPAPSEPGEPEQLLLTGAPLVKIDGRAKLSRDLPPDLARALDQDPPDVGRTLRQLVFEDGALNLGTLAFASATAGAAIVLEALLFRALLDMAGRLHLPSQRLALAAALLVFLLLVFVLDIATLSAALRLGRHLEARLRILFLSKLPRLGDRYLRSRPSSDMAERCHALHQTRAVPLQARRLIEAFAGLAVTTGAITWLNARSGLLAIACALVTLVLPLATYRLLVERDLRARSHAGALSRFYLEALVALTPIRAHAAERSVEREHSAMLGEWVRASRSHIRATVLVTGAHALVSSAIAALLVSTYLRGGGQIAELLLMAYWGLALPTYGEEIAAIVAAYPTQRNVALRALEPLGAPDEQADEPPSAPPNEGPVAIELDKVVVRAGGREILLGIDLSIAQGEHVAVVGSSGAGKSTLVGLLLGMHAPSSGRLLIDGEALDPSRLEALRNSTAWVDPSVQLWNRTLLDNLRYGGASEEATPLATVLDAADLVDVLERMPSGLETRLGEAGGLVSGGEGQRVRFGRALGLHDARLAILDEPFRGLDGAQRRELFTRARARWQNATLLYVTHDLSHALEMPRVVVIHEGRVVEDGAPRALAEADTLFAEMLAAERHAREELRQAGRWRRLRLAHGKLSEGSK